MILWDRVPLTTMSTNNHYMNYAMAAGTSQTVKIRPMTYEPHIMPPPTQLPWSSCDMTWSNASPSTGIMEFKGEYAPAAGTKFVQKRKADNEIPSILYTSPKRQITDEKMAEHLNALHISSTYTSHQQTTQHGTRSWDYDGMSIESEPSTSQSCYNIPMTSQDLEQKLKNAQRITVCEQIRKIQNEPILPNSLLERIERPCTALVLWQPPPKLTNLIASASSVSAIEMDDSNNNNNNNCIDEQDNNNSSRIDYNCSMDMEL